MSTDRIDVADAYPRVTSGQALLVCAYEDEQKCRQLNLQGSISLARFESMAPTLTKDRELIFYCA